MTPNGQAPDATGITFGLGMRDGLQDDWATAAALVCAVALAVAALYWWIAGPMYWAGRR